jgi:hypothetical protein
MEHEWDDRHFRFNITEEGFVMTAARGRLPVPIKERRDGGAMGREILRLAERVKELEAGSAPDTLALVASNVRAERDRIRTELIDAQDCGALSLGRDELLDVLDQICPEEK